MIEVLELVEPYLTWIAYIVLAASAAAASLERLVGRLLDGAERASEVTKTSKDDKAVAKAREIQARMEKAVKWTGKAADLVSKLPFVNPMRGAINRK